MPYSCESHNISPCLFLEYGMDGTSGEDARCEICERGMRFHAPWQFEVGALINIAFSLDGESRATRLEAEGMVVECCRAEEEKRYVTTLAFVEPPGDLKQHLGKVSARLTTVA